jgi:thymidylate synthase
MTKQYQSLLKEVLKNGDVFYEPRTEEYVIGISSYVLNYDLREGFPNLTTKKVPVRLPIEELFWKLRGEKNVKSLVERDVNIWTANAFDRYLKTSGLFKEEIPKHTSKWNEEFDYYKERIKADPEFAMWAGDLGPVYGFQWRHWEKKNGEEVDQLVNAINGIKNNPGSRYHALSAWNVGELEEMAIGPCPFWHQFSVYGKYLDLTVTQRSNDSFLGNPFNDTQDAAFLILMANETGLIPRYFHHQTINTHIYLGVAPRSNFWEDEKNVKKFKEKFRGIKNREEYLVLRDEYLKKAPEESEGNERKDHLPLVLEQLSKKPLKLPTMELINPDLPFLEAIELPAMEVFQLKNYNYSKWDSKAVMAT